MSAEQDVLVEEKIVVEQDGGESRREVFLRIGHPQWMKGGDEAACAVAIKGLDQTMPLVRGRDFSRFARAPRVRSRSDASTRRPACGCFIRSPAPPTPGEPLDREELEDCWRQLGSLYSKEWSVLVQRKILMQESGSKERSKAVLQIGHPYWEIEGESAVCPIAMKGLDDGPPVIHGDDSFGALSNAVRHKNEYFSGVQCGRWFFLPNGQPYAGDFPDIAPNRHEPDPRGLPGNWDVLAERVLWMELDGEPRRRIRIQVGRPYTDGQGQAYCPMAIKGLHGDSDDQMPGVSPFGAFVSALGFFEMHVMQSDAGARYFWPDGTPYEGELFGPQDA